MTGGPRRRSSRLLVAWEFADVVVLNYAYVHEFLGFFLGYWSVIPFFLAVGGFHLLNDSTVCQVTETTS
jgi:hypothetical protein